MLITVSTEYLFYSKGETNEPHTPNQECFLYLSGIGCSRHPGKLYQHPVCLRVCLLVLSCSLSCIVPGQHHEGILRIFLNPDKNTLDAPGVFFYLNLQQMIVVYLGIYFLTILLKVYDIIDFGVNREKIRASRLEKIRKSKEKKMMKRSNKWFLRLTLF